MHMNNVTINVTKIKPNLIVIRPLSFCNTFEVLFNSSIAVFVWFWIAGEIARFLIVPRIIL